jgi:hypothetical protein
MPAGRRRHLYRISAAAELGDATVRPQEEPTHDATQPDQDDLEPARQGGRIHDQVDGEEVNRRAGTEDDDVKQCRDDRVGQSSQPGTSWSE